MGRTRILVIVGVILLVVGILGLVYDGFTLERTEKHKVGPLSIEVPTQDEVRVPHLVAWILCGAGVASIAAGLFAGSGPKGV
jgi:hypothetical protein